MPTLMEHDKHGRTHAYSAAEIESLKKNGWRVFVEPVVAPALPPVWETPIVKDEPSQKWVESTPEVEEPRRGPGRPRKVRE